MGKINIPFKVDNSEYTTLETKMKDAETLKALQEIAINLSNLNITLSTLNSKGNCSKSKK
tara:strand:- start:41 stop:220 length:180 start_codon:yes stop_codon:yes gene_type:complete